VIQVFYMPVRNLRGAGSPMMTIRSQLACGLLAAALLPALLLARQGQVATIVASDGKAFDRFGSSLASHLNLLVVGSPYSEPGGWQQDSGSAYLFERLNGAWSEVARLNPSLPTHHGAFGEAVAIGPETVAVGSSYAEINSVATGAVHLFQVAQNNWFERAVLVGSSTGLDDRYGSAVAYEGSTLLVGAVAGNAQTGRQGQVYVYRETPQAWIEEALLMPTLSSMVPQAFGATLAIAGDLIAIGAPERGVAGIGKGIGAVYLYKRNAGVWSLLRVLLPPLGDAGQRFGAALAFSDGLLAVGAPATFLGGPLVGRVYLFELATGSHLPASELLPPGLPIYGRFGSSLAFQDSLLAIGSPGYSEIRQGEGTAWLYGEVGAGWIQLAELTGTKPEPWRNFGQAMVLAGDELLVSGPGSSPANPSQGQVNVHTRTTLPDYQAYCLGFACPCGNIDDRGGCYNSTGRGVRLSAWGSLSLSAADLSLTVERLVPYRMSIYFVGSPMTMAIGGDGLRCVGPGSGSGGYYLSPAVAPVSGTISMGPGRIAHVTGAVAGQSLDLQVWYRDPGGPCGMYFNSSNAIALKFQP
jgi:hypothetical protein